MGEGFAPFTYPWVRVLLHIGVNTHQVSGRGSPLPSFPDRVGMAGGRGPEEEGFEQGV
jgi:hypothetical protein